MVRALGLELVADPVEPDRDAIDGVINRVIDIAFLAKFRVLAHGVLDEAEIDRCLVVTERFEDWGPDELGSLPVTAPTVLLASPTTRGIC